MDKNKQHYQKWFRDQYAFAMRELEATAEALTWSKHAYIAFEYKTVEVNLVFYPHKTKSTGNISLRVRNQNSKDSAKAFELMRLLYVKSGLDNTFYHKRS